VEGAGQVRQNTVKRTLHQGGVALGTLVMEFNSTGISRVAAAAGAEFVIFDMEHTGWSVETIRMLLAAARATPLVPLVRVPDTQYHLMSRPLDVGAMGLMVPLVESEEQARAIVRAVKYPPVGRRGMGLTPAHPMYDVAGDQGDKLRLANEEQLIIAQIETVRGVESVESIAAVDGIDVLWIGHVDLTNSMGIPGQFQHPDFLRAVGRVVGACRSHGKAAGFMASSLGEARDFIARGFRCIAYWTDYGIYGHALQQALGEIRAGAGPGALAKLSL
jgi:2-keto-3-deoxy-L-rhamnonate aldolase RhmA